MQSDSIKQSPFVIGQKEREEQGEERKEGNRIKNAESQFIDQQGANQASNDHRESRRDVK